MGGGGIALIGWWALATLPLVLTLLLVWRFRFEAIVGLRYLGRTRPVATRSKVALGIALGLLAAGLLLIFTGGRQGWVLGLASVFLLVGGFGALAAAMTLRFSVFTTVSTMGLALGVAALIVVVAVTSGFRRDFLTRVTSFHGHLVVGLYGEPSLTDARTEIDALKTKIANLPGLIGTGPFAVTVAEVSIGPASATLKAIDPKASANPLARWMQEGDLAELTRPLGCGGAGSPPPGEFVGHIVLGRPLATRVRARVGECVNVVIPFGGPDRFYPTALAFRVVGIFEMGFHQHDTRLAYVALDDLEKLEGERPFIYGLELLFRDPVAALGLVPDLEEQLGAQYRILDWRLLSQGLFASLETQRIVIGLFLSMIILVSAFNVVASLTIVVVSKTREIAVFGALGARPHAVLRIFVLAGGIAGLLGTAAGIVAGLAICALVKSYHFQLEAAVYMIAELPIDLAVRDILVVAGMAQLACLLATVPPVLRARRLRVVDGLRQI